ncbi:MAG: lytic transglycosylase domain-containing protein [Desulfomicrobium sp.]|nr:lytic transglycosylase domain-containing protein [Desulfomicrobium sp.]
MYYMVKEDGSLCITDIPTSRKYKPYKFERTINYIRNAVVAFKRDHRSVEEVNAIVSGLCAKYGVDKKLVMAVIDVESGFNAAAVSTAGAQGLMQIMPATGRDLDLVDPFDPSENIDAGIRYLRYLLDTFPDRRLAVAAYNAGPNAVKKYGGIPPYTETQNYVEKVWARLQNYE